MGKYGKKHIVDLNPLSYSICLCGLGGIGKTTLAKEVCEKLVGEDGYIHFNIGREGGVDAINNIISEDIPDWQTFIEVTNDIIENKVEEYPNLKVVILDSLDEIIRIGEDEVIRLEKKKDSTIDSILKCKGGFGKGQDFCINMILDRVFELKSVGVQSFIIAHTKKADLVDAVTQMSYSQLVADVQSRYFNAIKNKMDIVAVGYLDRQIATEKTGRKNIVTKQDITINRITEEARMIAFRDDSYNIDSKSRFANIVDKIPFDSDEFITAIQDAIAAENKRVGITESAAKKAQTAKDKKLAEEAAENSKAAKDKVVNVDRNEELVTEIKDLFKSSDESTLKPVKSFMKEHGISSFKEYETIPTKDLEEILHLLSQ